MIILHLSCKLRRTIVIRSTSVMNVLYVICFVIMPKWFCFCRKIRPLSDGWRCEKRLLLISNGHLNHSDWSHFGVVSSLTLWCTMYIKKWYVFPFWRSEDLKIFTRVRRSSCFEYFLQQWDILIISKNNVFQKTSSWA